MADELNPPLGTTTPEIFMDNVKRADELVNGPAGTVNDRGGEPLDTWRQMMAKNDEIRQNLVPLSKQYMTLEAAQADIRAIQKQNNAALVGNELLLNQPVLMEFRTGTANNFVLVASGPVAAELNARLLSLELNSLTIVSSVAASADAYTGTTANTTSSQVLVTGRAFVFTPSASNTTRTPTLSLNGWTARTIKQAGGTALAVGDLVSGSVDAGVLPTRISPLV